MEPSDINRQSVKIRTVRVCCWSSVWLLCGASVPIAVAMQAPVIQPQAPRVHGRTKAIPTAGAQMAIRDEGGVDARSSQEPNPAAHSNTGAGLATVVLADGSLTVTADNSDLSQIIETLARMSGMSINGNLRSSRVYGVYGPLDPRDVLSHLLKGSGNNFLMVGVVRDGVPRELLLTPEKTAPPSTTDPAQPTAAPRVAEESQVDSSEKVQLGPGAILHVPPAPSEDPEVRSRQNLERLKHRHDQQIQQNPPQ